MARDPLVPPGRYRCPHEACAREFDDESERDRHAGEGWHCKECGVEMRVSRIAAKHGVCEYCFWERFASENESTAWH